MPHEHFLKQNRLLSALSTENLAALKPHLELALLESGSILVESDAYPDNVYFPIDSSISLYYGMKNGESSEIALIGNEGMFSIAHIMGGETMPYFASVETTGHAFKINRKVLKKEIDSTDSLRQTLLLYSQAALTQMAQSAVCGRNHTLYQQLCLHLLMLHDNSLANNFVLTHKALAHMLGVRREGMTSAAKKLLDNGIIDYKRSTIKVVSRAGLESQCCECYEVVRKEFQRLLGYS